MKRHLTEKFIELLDIFCSVAMKKQRQKECHLMLTSFHYRITRIKSLKRFHLLQFLSLVDIRNASKNKKICIAPKTLKATYKYAWKILTDC